MRPLPARVRPSSVHNAFLDYFKCPEQFAELETPAVLSERAGYFTFGNAICYGRVRGQRPADYIEGPLPDVSEEARPQAGHRLQLPFDLTEVVTNLREERYRQKAMRGYLDRFTGARAARSLYYFLRPVLPVSIRKHIQKLRLSGWQRIAFPQWPVDAAVDTLMLQTMALALKSQGVGRIPFIWFWPDGAPSCVMMTHDVEDSAGREFCGELMDLDDSFGIKSAFQLVPEMRGESSKSLANAIRGRGFEVNLHDLNHDGYLFQDRAQFLERAVQINRYASELQCRGFRSGAMYREQQWYDAFEFFYDMSVPNVAHLEPQRGGCCTVMPYFVGNVLELPLTTTQDYSLFHILGNYSIELWKTQIDLILERHGLISFITHPDYLVERRARLVYTDLLKHLVELRSDKKVWFALPAEVDQWWRVRHKMKLVRVGNTWRIEGAGSERACLAYGSVEAGRLTYRVSES
jgi:hypothetical protein